MKEKTALQTLIEKFRTQQKQGHQMFTLMYEAFINEAELLLELEKKQIIDAYYAGTAQFANEAEIIKKEGPIQYFTDTYEQPK